MLSHLRVLDLAGRYGGLAGLLLAQFGADVILVEPPGGAPDRHAPLPVGPEGTSAWMATHGRGKRSVVLDLTGGGTGGTGGAGGAGRERFDALLASADVLIESWTPSEREALGLTPEATAVAHPRLVHASVTPFGATGPRAGWAATDLTIMAAASPLAVTGDRDRAPVRMSVPQAMSFGGAAAVGAVLVALCERERSGRGQHVDASAQAAAALAIQAGLLSVAVGAPAPVRSAGGAQMGAIGLRFLYPAADGFVSITHVFGEAGGPATARLMAWVHEAGFCSQEMRDKDWVRYAVLIDEGVETVEAWEEAKAAVAAFTSSRPKAELLAGAIEGRLLLAPVSDLREVLGSPHLAHRGFWEHVGGLTVPGRYARFSRWAPEPLGPAPALGAHTAEVLASLPEVPEVPTLPPAAPTVGADPAAGAGPGALAGLKVVDLTWSVAGPALTRTLADYGATVVKVESTNRVDASRTFVPFWGNQAGLERSALFDDLNAGKHSLTLNITTPEGKAVLDDLLRWADVVVDSFSPRGRIGAGLDDERVRALNPSIINLSVTLFGRDGPLAELAGYGNLGGALAGCYGITGWPDRARAGPYLAYTDYTSAHLMVATLVAAVHHRQRTGEGQFIELSQSETALQYLAPALAWTADSGELFTRMGNDDLVMAPHGVYPAAGDPVVGDEVVGEPAAGDPVVGDAVVDDDRWVAVACPDDEAWAALCRVIGRADLAAEVALATAAGRRAERRRLDEAVSAWTAARPAGEAVDLLQAAGVAAATVATSADCLADPQLAHRGHILRLDRPADPDRPCIVEGTRCVLSRTPGRPAFHAPTLGEQNFEVLADLLGYDTDRIAELAAAEVLE